MRPLGFKTDDKSLKRAGLDYWEGVKVTLIDDLVHFLKTNDAPFYFFSSKGNAPYTETSYAENALLIFGAETTGLPALFHEKWKSQFLKIPMKSHSRCLNLSNAVSIVLYEALRQQEFLTLK